MDKTGVSEDLRARAETVCNGFQGWLNAGDFSFQGAGTDGKDAYRNEKLGLVFSRDFPRGVPLSQSFLAVKSRYRRRIDRLLSLIHHAKTVLIVRMDRHELPHRTSIEDCIHARNILGARHSGTVFDILLIRPDPRLSAGNRQIEHPAEGIIRLSLNPEPTRIADALREMFTVREYRTTTEILDYRRRQLVRRWAENGALTAREYHWRKIALPLANAFSWLFGPSIARVRRKRFPQIVPLGVNCETGFRFYRKWGFVDSSPFVWAQSRNLATVTAALSHFDDILSGSVTLNPSDHLWLCGNSGIRFHGNLKHAPDLSPSQAELDADLADLRGRIGHLKHKFLDFVRNDKRTLFIHRLAAEDAADPGLDRKLDALEAALLNLGAKNWSLLVICERKNLSHMPKSPNRIFRAVRKFNPGSAIADARRGDSTGWNAVFSEFAPQCIMPKRHAFKFE